MNIMTDATVNNDLAIQTADDEVITIERWESVTGLFRLKLLKYVSVSTTITRSSAMDSGHSIIQIQLCLLLHTSGISGNKKLGTQL